MIKMGFGRNLFQSTPLMRGETYDITGATSNSIFQSTPLMRGETVRVAKIEME